jgi:hypothetical protein
MEKPWRRKTIAEKREAAYSAHARPTTCLLCGTRMMPSDRAAHRSRCPGRQEPEAFDTWESESTARGRGIATRTLRRHAARGALRSRERDGHTEYLTRDVEQLVDVRELFGGR